MSLVFVIWPERPGQTRKLGSWREGDGTDRSRWGRRGDERATGKQQREVMAVPACRGEAKRG